MWGTVANERDTANSCSIGGRNRLNVFMLIDVIVPAAVQSSKIEVRESFIAPTMPVPRRAGNAIATQLPSSKSDEDGWSAAIPIVF